MGIPAALLNQLAELSNSIGFDPDILRLPLRLLAVELRVAVPSYRGLRVTIVSSDQPVTLTDLSPQQTDGAIRTSLRVSLSLLSAEHEVGNRVIFYASTSGAFVDLAADLGYVLKTPVATHHFDGDCPGSKLGNPAKLVLDGDVPREGTESGLTGLSELSAINRAIGVLIARGHTPDDAYDMLRRAAAAAGVETHIYAARLLGR